MIYAGTAVGAGIRGGLIGQCRGLFSPLVEKWVGDGGVYPYPIIHLKKINIYIIIIYIIYLILVVIIIILLVILIIIHLY